MTVVVVTTLHTLRYHYDKRSSTSPFGNTHSLGKPLTITIVSLLLFGIGPICHVSFRSPKMMRPLIYVMEQQRSCVMRCFGPNWQYYYWQHITPFLFASSSTSLFSTSFSQSPQSPSKPASSWERYAKLVKNTDVTNPYLKQVRSEVVDPALQLKTIEDELCGAIGKAWGRQGEKVPFAIRVK